MLQGATEADAWSNLAVVAGSSELLRSDLPRPSFARWVRVLIQGSGDLRLWEFQVRVGDSWFKLGIPMKCHKIGKISLNASILGYSILRQTYLLFGVQINIDALTVTWAS